MEDDLEDGSICPECGINELRWVRPGDCSCHVWAPCLHCLSATLECLCGFVVEDV